MEGRRLIVRDDRAGLMHCRVVQWLPEEDLLCEGALKEGITDSRVSSTALNDQDSLSQMW